MTYGDRSGGATQTRLPRQQPRPRVPAGPHYTGAQLGQAWTAAANWAKAHPDAVTSTADIPGSAKAIVDGFLQQYGLTGLADWAFNEYVRLGGGQDAIAIIEQELPNQKAFQDRFPAYAALAKAGNAWTPAQIINYEEQARALLHAAGADPALMSSSYIQGALAKGVSLNEFSQRIAIATQAAQEPSEVTQSLRHMYGLNTHHLTSYFLDPDVTLPRLQQQFAAGQIGGAAREQGFGSLSAQEAERLSALGVNEQQAQQGFGQVEQLAGLANAQVEGEAGFGRATQIGLVSGQAASTLAYKQRVAARQAAFQGSDGFGVGQQGTTGLGGPAQ